MKGVSSHMVLDNVGLGATGPLLQENRRAVHSAGTLTHWRSYIDIWTAAKLIIILDKYDILRNTTNANRTK